jgi:putative transposase
MTAGARLPACCFILGLSQKTIKRWKINAQPDQRPLAQRPKSTNSLSQDEKDIILQTCNQPEYASMPPSQIVPKLADKGIYLASESTFYRILKEARQLTHRGKARAPKKKVKPTHTATSPNQVWVWDITYLHSKISGIYYKLYIISDLFSRKIIDYEVWPEENAEHSISLLKRAALKEKIALNNNPLILHGDNGSPLKAGTVLSTMQQLGITPSHSRPRVSNDNAHAEALFRTVKYHPSLPDAFSDLDQARSWSQQFVQWYNFEHQHSALRFVTPDQKHSEQDISILAKRDETYKQAMKNNPSRWIQKTSRNWTPVTQTSLNPINESDIEKSHKKSA